MEYKKVFNTNELGYIITKGTLDKPEKIKIVRYESKPNSIFDVYDLTTDKLIEKNIKRWDENKWFYGGIYGEDDFGYKYGIPKLLKCSQQVIDYLAKGEMQMPFHPFTADSVYYELNNLLYVEKYINNYLERVNQGLPPNDKYNGWYKYPQDDKISETKMEK